MSRESISAAILEKLTAIGGWRTIERKVRDKDQISPSECPYLGLAPGGGDRLSELGGPRMERIEWVAYLHLHDDSTVGPAPALNGYLDSIRDAFRHGPTDPVGMGTGQTTTLGGLVVAADVASVITDEGSYGARAMALVTIEVLAAG